MCVCVCVEREREREREREQRLLLQGMWPTVGCKVHALATRGGCTCNERLGTKSGKPMCHLSTRHLKL